MKRKKSLNRREFIGTAAAASIATIVPRHVLGGPGYVAPSDKINLAYIGCGTQGLREMCGLITNPELQIVSVCDPNKLSTNYIDWSPYAKGMSYRNQPTEELTAKMIRLSKEGGYRRWYGIESSGREEIKKGIEWLKKYLLQA